MLSAKFIRPARRVLATLTLLAGGTVVALGSSPASAAPLDAEAFGISAEEVVDGATELDLPPTPIVNCPPDASDEIVGFNDGRGSVIAGAINVDCSTTDGVVSSTATVANASLTGFVSATVIEATCTANGDPVGESTFADLNIAGQFIDVTGEPNQEVPIPGFGTVTINAQTTVENPDGTSTITVQAVVIDFDPESAEPTLPNVTLDLVLSSVSCTSSLDVPPTTGTTTPATTTPATTIPATTIPARTIPATTIPATTTPATTTPGPTPTTDGGTGPAPTAPPAQPIEGRANFTG